MLRYRPDLLHSYAPSAAAGFGKEDILHALQLHEASVSPVIDLPTLAVESCLVEPVHLAPL